MPPSQRRVLIIGGSFSGLAAGRDLGSHYLVTIIDAKEYFEYTPGVLRAYVKPKHLDALTFTLQPVIETRMGCKYIWGEVKELNGAEKTATYKPIFTSERETIDFDYCIIAAGCNFGPFHKWGESLWFPTIHEDARPEGSWPHLDERYLEGRRRHVLEEFNFLKSLNDKSATCLVVGAGFIGVEWATEIQHFFPRVKLTIIDFLPQPLGPLPASAAKYCEKYMNKVGIKQFYNTKYDAKNPEFWKSIDMVSGPDKEYVCIGVKASNYFMPKETLSEKGPGGGGWILMNQNLSVKTRDGKLWGADDKGFPRIYAVGDCNYGCIEEAGKKPDDWPLPPIPKISYPGEEMCIVACTNIEKIDRLLFQSKTVDCCGDPLKVWDMHWPWGAGMFATSLGPDDACFVAGANWQKNSGLMCVWGQVCAVQKEFIEASKTDECAYGFIGRCIWYFVHHTPVRRVLIIGGSFSGLAAGRDLGSHYLVTIIDAKEYFEYTPGVLRAYVKPKHLDALTFTLQPVIETRMGCKFIWGEVKELNAEQKTATYKPIFTTERETIDFDYCIIAAGCNFGPFHKWGESLWFPTIHEDARPEGSWPHLDERYLEGRRRHVLEEFNFLKSLHDKSATCLVVGAGFIGVEWATEIQHFFPRVKLTIIDFLPQPLGPLPATAAKYCEKYMNKVGIKQFYNTKYDAKNPEFWKSIDLPNGPDKEYVCIGVKASNYFMPKETLSEKGPGGGGWILMNQNLSVKTRDGKLWGADEKGFPRIYAVGDCNYGCIEEAGKKPDDWPIPPIPKISYPGEEMCIVACTNIEKTDRLLFQSKTVDCCGDPLKVWDMHWPWGAGMFATSLGPDDACFVAGANWQKNSGLMCVWGQVCAVQKEFIEASKTDECAYGFIGRCIWYFVHHTPVHLFGGGPRWGY
ncbi:Apoptosis-inducing factor homolog B [Durusdinium trenchii]|uniref:Apoptosis-inducing factor homolog B n=1 Tax=Durusdinium trenchii TaxID=1381693 RepID=A0ABP0RT30_9DINO